MDRLRTLQTFITVADHVSFAEAARRLRVSPTTVTRAVAALERELGTTLLTRTTRMVRLTEEGAMFLERCRSALAEIEEATRAAQGGGTTPRGSLTVTAPVTFGQLHVVPIVLDMLRSFPDLRIRLLLLDRVANLAAEGIDIAVRIGKPVDSTLKMLKVGEVRRVFSASPEYIRVHGSPRSSADLQAHAVVGIEDERGSLPSHYPASWGHGDRWRTRLSVNNVNVAIAAALEGAGVVGTLSYQVAAHLRAGRLVEVLQDEGSAPLPISMLFASGRRQTPNVRIFVELARARLKSEL